MWPGIGMLAAAALNVLLGGFVAIAGFTNAKGMNFGPQEGVVGVGIIVAALVSAIGAVSLIRLRSRGLAVAGAILLMLPCCSPCLLASLPMGIWAMVVLNDADVKAAFSGPEEVT